MSGKSSRTKGHAWERQVASYFRDWGFDAQTTRSLRGGYQGDADVLLKDYEAFIECKARKRLAMQEWMATMIERAPPEAPRFLFTKVHGLSPDKGEWVTMPREDFDKLFQEGCDQFWRRG